MIAGRSSRKPLDELTSTVTRRRQPFPLNYRGERIQIGGRYRTVVNFYWDKVVQQLFAHYEEQEMTTIILDFNVSENTDELNRKNHDEILKLFYKKTFFLQEVPCIHFYVQTLLCIE